MFFSQLGFAADNLIGLEKAPVNRDDINSIKRGAKVFATTCIACHTLIYLKYDKLANDAGITYAKMPVNIVKWPFDVKPPDLSLEASYRGVNWIYTYLHSFYQDKTSPTGFNNLLVVNSKMTNILMPLQGLQIKIEPQLRDKQIYDHELQWYDVVILKQPGSMTPAQFDGTITDVVNFLAYASEPYRLTQEKIGLWVLIFLFILFVLTVLLKKEYWKNVK